MTLVAYKIRCKMAPNEMMKSDAKLVIAPSVTGTGKDGVDGSVIGGWVTVVGATVVVVVEVVD